MLKRGEDGDKLQAVLTLAKYPSYPLDSRGVAW
jgi:hypothetical protein